MSFYCGLEKEKQSTEQPGGAHCDESRMMRFEWECQRATSGSTPNDFSRAAAYYLINASEVVNNLKCQQIVDKNTRTSVLPTKASQCRPLAKLPPEQQREVWHTAVEKAQGKVPSARIVEEIINKDKSQPNIEKNPTDKEIIYKPGTGIDYVVHLDEETYLMLQTYQDIIGTATKRGAIRRLLEDAITVE